MMTRKDYEAAAAIVREHAKAEARENGIPIAQFNIATSATAVTMEAFVSFFRKSNGRFDADRFREACEPQG